MNGRRAQLHLGLGAVVAALLLIFWLIPGWISAPSNVGNVILSPLFWPYTLAGLVALTGLGLIGIWWRMAEDPEPLNEPIDDPGQAWARLAAMAAIMITVMVLLPRLGMVWTAMLCFAATAFLVRTRHPRAAIVCAVLVPLVLYAFFAHVAGVAIPQGDYVRLP